MREFEAVLVSLLAVAIIQLLSRKIEIPYPILLVIGGLILAFIPGLPRIRLQPDVVFLLFLPPLLYPAALFTSWRDFRASLRVILLLAIGLVLCSTLVAAWLAHGFMKIPWAAAFALGAIISPPDAIAAVAITKRLRVPRRVVTVLEGESLVNDATSLVLFRFAVRAAVLGTFSIWLASFTFLLAAAGGALVGWLGGVIMAAVHRRLDDPPIQITFSLLTPFAIYLLAERLEVSGVLAVVVAGLYLGWRLPETTNSRVRLQAGPVWEMVQFLLNGLVFILIGLELPGVLHTLKGYSYPTLFSYAVLISTAMILVRIVWVFAASYVPRFLSKTVRQRDPYPNWRAVMVVAWSGMRGVDSLAAALAIPFTLQNGSPFPARDLLVFLTYTVIFTTLVLQGLTLPGLIRFLGVKDDRLTEKEEHEARLKANEAALARLEQLSGECPEAQDALDRLRAEYEDRIEQLQNYQPETEAQHKLFSSAYENLSMEALEAERRTILRLRNEAVINDEAMRRIQHDIDLAEARLKHPHT
jgi:Na+/H+ antiporter